MKRRTFAQLSMGLIGGAAMQSFWRTGQRISPSKGQLIKPKAIQQGDTIGIISPSGAIRSGQLKEAVSLLKELGLRPHPAPHCDGHYGYFSATDAERLSDIHYCLENEEIDAIWCLRGGYGLTRILHQIDYKLFRQRALAVIGYSDITALHQALYTQAGIVSFHGPVLISDFNPYVKQQAQQVFQPTDELPLLLPHSEHEVETLRAGQAEGRLLGGNLSLLAALAGTPYLPSFKDALVFIEDVEEEPYRIDRMLTQLVHTADLNKASGVILGQFAGCEKKPEDNYSFTLRETLDSFVADWSGPVLYNFSIGHIKRQCTLPHGIKVRLDTDKAGIQLLESPITIS
ncbi:MAG: LD-carboxypeptidase [Bacteroidetes bacterium]|jgi:muramoyltetrapeptide carboxypeptidase|nr:LD-carboxypeptidase [Bacteroidota bacterium]